jgi:hypothetical protein
VQERGKDRRSGNTPQEEMTVARAEERLKLGKGAAFAKGRFKRLRQAEETWEADFRALPKPVTQSQTHYLGMVVAPDCSFLADARVEGRPTANDMATLLSHAMRRPLAGKAQARLPFLPLVAWNTSPSKGSRSIFSTFCRMNCVSAVVEGLLLGPVKGRYSSKVFFLALSFCLRGREWVRAVNQEFPDITVLLTFGYAVAQPGGRARDRSEAPYGLLADFLDGVLDACSNETTVVDAWESAYPYKERRQFERAYETIKGEALGWTAVPGKYRKQVQAGFGIWMDYDWRKKGWDTADFSKNHFRPAEFEGAVRSALRVSDRYVWVYTEQPRWWTGAKLPQAYVDALTNARKGVRPARGAPAEKSKAPPVKKVGTIDLGEGPRPVVQGARD